jgi:cytochrome P450
MVTTAIASDVESLPLAPKNPLSYWDRLRCGRAFDTGPETLRDAGGPVTRSILGPRQLVPPIVFVTSPQGAHDVLGRTDAVADRGEMPIAKDFRHLLGGNLLVLPHDEWMPRRRAVQPMFTKQHVPRYAGHMAQAAEDVSRGWGDDDIDLDMHCRALTLRALGRSVLGLDLDRRADEVGPALRTALEWLTDRATRPLRVPRWLPIPAQRRAHAAKKVLHDLAAEILDACRADSELDAPLVRALIAAKDQRTGLQLTDREICDELVLFMLAGHDTTSTTITYALWALGHDQRLQDRVFVEVAELGNRTLTPDDIPRLGFTVSVLHEALRLCPPAPIISRMVMQDIEVDCCRVAAGSIAVVGVYAMHRDPALWDNPLEFDPDRFSPQRSQGRSRWQYLPFGGGPRSCIGDHFAMLEATLAVATIVGNVDIRSLDREFATEVPFTTVAAGPIRVRARQRI